MLCTIVLAQHCRGGVTLTWCVEVLLMAVDGLSCDSDTITPDTRADKFESFERINSIRVTNGNFDSCNSCKRLVSSSLHELHESNFSIVTRIEFIRSKLLNFSAHVSGVYGRDRCV